LKNFKVHIIHVGNMANKGSQALIFSDVYVIRKIVGDDVSISVSTTDIEGMRKLGLPLDKITQPLVDIPYEKADSYARRFGFSRKSFWYKILGFASFYLMFVQAFLSVFSIFLSKVGFKPIYRSETIKCMKNCDLIVSYSDENFKEAASMLPLNIYWVLAWWSMLASRAWEIISARLLNKPVVMFPNSIGPFRTFVGRFLAKVALNNCCVVLIREPISYEVVNSLNVRAEKILTSDTSILFSSILNRKSYCSKERLAIGVSPGIYAFSLSRNAVQDFVLSHAMALDDVIEKYGVDIVFLPHYVTGFEADDLEICKLIVNNMEHKEKTIIVNTRSVEDFAFWISQMRMIVSSKMHPAVIAASFYVPFVLIAYDHKQYGFALSLGLNDCVLPINEVSPDTLFSKIKYVLENRSALKEALKKHVPRLQNHVKDSIAFALASFMPEIG